MDSSSSLDSDKKKRGRPRKTPETEKPDEDEPKPKKIKKEKPNQTSVDLREKFLSDAQKIMGALKDLKELKHRIVQDVPKHESTKRLMLPDHDEFFICRINGQTRALSPGPLVEELRYRYFKD